MTLSDSLGLKAVAEGNKKKRKVDPGDLLLNKVEGKAITIFNSLVQLRWVFEARSKQIRGTRHWANRSD
jgi:hypothetical protein